MNQRDIVLIAGFTFITIVLWIISDVYHAISTSQITEVQEELLTPLNPAFDPTTITKIKQRSL